MAALYDEIGSTYSTTRQGDPRIAKAVEEALGDSRSVVNVGAGTGAYEPRGRNVVAVEPSAAMIARRPPGAAAALQGHAESLPLADASVDAAMAIFTIHHWSDLGQGLRELRRVAWRRAVILTWDPSYAGTFWLTVRYLPGLDRWSAAHFPPIEAVASELGPLERIPLPVPHDCEDGFLRAFWRRPEAYCLLVASWGEPASAGPRRSEDGRPAVDRNGGAGDVGGLVRGEERHQRRHLLRPAEPA